MKRWRSRRWLLALGFLLAVFGCQSERPIGDAMGQLRTLERKGEFTRAEALIDSLLGAAKLDSATRRRLLWDRERLSRIRLDYNLSRQDLLKALRERVRDFREAELDEWEREGKLDVRRIDGEKRYLYASVSNLFWRYPEIRARRLPKENRWDSEHSFLALVREARAAREKSAGRFVLPHRFRCTHTVEVHADAVPAGKIVRCWIPFPRAFPFQNDIHLVDSEPAVKWLGEPESRARSAYLERRSEPGVPTVFKVSYEFTAYATINSLEPARIRPYDKSRPEYVYYTAERPPHIVFSEAFRALSRRIVGGETNPLLVARRIFNWIADSLAYSYAPEYSTISNISQWVLQRRYGDCGQKALFFMTLCRLNGIPARWQSGWGIRPGHKSIHDWCEIYLEPYGWVPVDPDRGAAANRYTETLTPGEKQEVVDFYFGNLDPFRMAANCDHSVPLFPPKQSFRSDDVDFQRAEVECDGQNVYFDKFDYSLEVKVLKHP